MEELHGLATIKYYAKINNELVWHKYSIIEDKDDCYLRFTTSHINGDFILARGTLGEMNAIFVRETTITNENGFVATMVNLVNRDIQMNIPMKAKPYGEGRPNYPMYYQPKINGGRCIDELTEVDDIFVKCMFPTLSAKEGGLIPVQHLIDQLRSIHAIFGRIVFDGEIYLYGHKCATINGAARNPKNPIHKDLALVIFDVILYGVSQFVRVEILNHVKRTMLLTTDVQLELNLTNNKIAKANVFFLATNTIWSEQQARKLAEEHIDAGYEGIVLREKEAIYRQGKHVGNLYKMKKALYGYFKIVGIDPKPIDTTQPMFLLLNDKTSEVFECNPTGDHGTNAKYLKYKSEYIGKMVQVKYYERTINDLPFHANVFPETMKDDIPYIEAKDTLTLNTDDL